eukprot:scpid82798/ scgid22140/ 
MLNVAVECDSDGQLQTVDSQLLPASHDCYLPSYRDSECYLPALQNPVFQYQRHAKTPGIGGRMPACPMTMYIIVSTETVKAFLRIRMTEASQAQMPYAVRTECQCEQIKSSVFCAGKMSAHPLLVQPKLKDIYKAERTWDLTDRLSQHGASHLPMQAQLSPQPSAYPV